MTLVFFILSVLLIWGGLIASTIFYIRKPELDNYPPEELPLAGDGGSCCCSSD